MTKLPVNLRKNIAAAEYKHIALGLVFLKYISDSFETLFRYSLSRLRNALVPELMKGEIRVIDADKFAENII